MSAITSVYLTGSNKIGSQLSVSILILINDTDIVTYQWYRSPTYDGLFEIISDETNNYYYININDRYLKCIVTINGLSYESNIVVVDQLSVSEANQNKINVKLSNIGRGLSYNTPVSQVSGASNIAYDIARVNQSINLILSIAFGEVPMLPDLGCNLHERLFGGTTDEDIELIRLDVESALEQEEPRIQLESVDVEYDEQHTVHVIVNYTIRNTNIRSQYIYVDDLDKDGEYSE